jgi:glycerol uptake facilitator-like aquaporin
VYDDYSLWSAFVGETMGTFILVWAVLMTAVNNKSMAANLAPIAIGWSVLLAHLLLIPITGCGINPARSFGSHFVSWCAGANAFDGEESWIFYTAPFLGSAFATALSYSAFDVSSSPKEQTPVELEYDNADHDTSKPEQAA